MKNIISKLEDLQIDHLARSIAKELHNRNLFALVDLQMFISDNPKTDFGISCSNLYRQVKDFLSEDDNFDDLRNLKEKPDWIRYALFFGEDGGKSNLDKVAVHLTMSLVQQRSLKLDDYIENLNNLSLTEELNLNINNEFLTNVSNDRFEIRMHGIILDNKTLIYPHQFLRRYYSSHFVGLPSLLGRAVNEGVNVFVRIDPLRVTQKENYREIMEFDHWYGPHFSDDLLEDEHKNQRTVHSSRGVYSMSYDARYTVFRTKMMDTKIREFMIEEYCPTESPIGRRSPGVGSKYSIQKFAHFCYDQEQKVFTHLDGAVRVFTIQDYENHFGQIEKGIDVDEKIGKRHKLFLVEGAFDKSLVQELLTEWFRYNPHIQEYFSGIVMEPSITYEKLREVSLKVGDSPSVPKN